jgi:DtxR family Mn-dependent transcriptional regulator
MTRLSDMPHPQVSKVVEDYVTLIWKAYEWADVAPQTTELADRLGVTPSTVSANLKKLAREGWVAYEAYGPVTLTAAGHEVALEVVRRHRIIETYLVQRLGLGWDQVHTEADALEHSVSDLVLAAMEKELGYPTRDPHGDPIPTRGGDVHAIDAARLTDVPAGFVGTIARVADRHPDVLRYLDEKGLRLDTTLTVQRTSSAAGIILVSADERSIELPLSVADAVWLSPAPEQT